MMFSEYKRVFSCLKEKNVWKLTLFFRPVLLRAELVCPPRAQPPPCPHRHQDGMFVTHHYQPESVVYIREVWLDLKSIQVTNAWKNRKCAIQLKFLNDSRNDFKCITLCGASLLLMGLHLKFEELIWASSASTELSVKKVCSQKQA